MATMGSLLAPLLTLSLVSSTVVAPGSQPSQITTVELSARGGSVETERVSTQTPEESTTQAGSTEAAPATQDVQTPSQDLAQVLDPYGLRPSHRSHPGKGLTISSYVVGGIGTGLMLVGVTYLGLSMKQRDKISSESVETLEERRDVLQQIGEYDRNMTIFLSAGAGTLALATMLFLAGRRQRARAATRGVARMSVGSWTRRGGLGLTLRGVF